VIQRYENCYGDMQRHEEGKWVKWDDVKDFGHFIEEYKEFLKDNSLRHFIIEKKEIPHDDTN